VKVKEIMKKKVIYFSPSDSIFKVAKIFSQKNISGAPVVENGKVVGVISETDIIKFIRMKFPSSIATPQLSLLILNFLKNTFGFREEVKKVSKLRVKDLMSKKVVSISPKASILEAAEKMEKFDVQRLPVIEKGKLVGIISRADLVKTLIK
jgi:CBS domain-containing protein